jgi:general secretion pathway protein N
MGFSVRKPVSSLRTAGVASWRAALAGGITGAVITLLVCAPATWLQNAVTAWSEGRVSVRDGAGTLWSGSAQVALTGGTGSRDAVQLPGRAHWSVQMSWTGLRGTLLAPCCMREAAQWYFSPGWNHWQLRVDAHESTWPAALLSGLGTPWNTLRPEGGLAVRTPGFSLQGALGRWTLQGTIDMEARDLSSRVSTLRPLGSYRLVLTGGQQSRLGLSTLRGSLQLSGQGQWTSGRLHFVGEARADEAHQPELSNLLNIMGRRDGARSVISLG